MKLKPAVAALTLSLSFLAACSSPSQKSVPDDSKSLPRHPPLPVGNVIPGPDMTRARAGNTATTLPDFTVLIAGGRDEHGVILASAEVYDPTTEKFTAAGKMSVPREGHIAAVLEDGKIIIAGGLTGGGLTGGGLTGGGLTGSSRGSTALSSSEDYDYETGKFTVRGNMHARRVRMAATTLRDGKILVTGGEDGAHPLDSAETYDVLTGKWTLAGRMTAARADHSATLLSDGRVLIVGGTGMHRATLASAEVFDPRTNQFTATSSLHEARSMHTSALLADGRVLIAGGSAGPGENDASSNGKALPPGKALASGNALASAEIYDPRSGTFTPTGKLNEPRFKLPASTLLLDGRVLIAGGAASIEIYDPKTGLFRTVTGALDTVRYDPAVIQLMDGSARIFGGYDPKGAGTAKTWTYRP